MVSNRSSDVLLARIITYVDSVQIRAQSELCVHRKVYGRLRIVFGSLKFAVFSALCTLFRRLMHSTTISNCIGLPFARAQLAECKGHGGKSRHGQEVSGFVSGSRRN